MVRVAFIFVLLGGAVACAAQDPVVEGSPKVLIQLGSIYSHAEDDVEFAKDVHILAAECAKDPLRRMQFAYDAIELAKLMEPKSCYVTLVEFAKSLPKEDAKEFRSLIMFELWRLAVREYGETFGLHPKEVQRLFAGRLRRRATIIARILTGRSASGFEFDVSRFGILARAALDSCSNQQERFDTYWDLKDIGLFAPVGGFCFRCYEDHGFGVFPVVLARPFDREDVELPFPAEGGKPVRGKWDRGKITQDQVALREFGALWGEVGGQQVAILNLQARLGKLENRVDGLEAIVAVHEQRIARCELRDAELEKRVNALAKEMHRPKRGFFHRVGDALGDAAGGVANAAKAGGGAAKNLGIGMAQQLGGFLNVILEPVVNAIWDPDDAERLDGLPDNADAEGRRLAVQFGFDKLSPYPSPAVSRKSNEIVINGGLKPTGHITGGCRKDFQLQDANEYYRMAKSKDGKFAVHMYALYFMKDQWALQAPPHLPMGHRHDWEYALVWTTAGNVTHASCSAHGELSIVRLNQGPVRVMYYKDGFATHSFRFAGRAEGANWTGKLLDWERMERAFRDKLNGANFGDANCPVSDRNFAGEIAKGRPPGYPPTDDWLPLVR